MKSFLCTCLVSAALVCAVSGSALALSEDDKTMNNSNGDARYSDPDEQMPVSTIMLQPPSSANHLTNKESSPNAVDPASVRYDYDKDSGTYIPHTN